MNNSEQKTINFYKMSGVGWINPAYYAAYELETAKHYAYSDNNSSFLLESVEVPYPEIPKGTIIRKAGLSREHARALTLKQEQSLIPHHPPINQYIATSLNQDGSVDYEQIKILGRDL